MRKLLVVAVSAFALGSATSAWLGRPAHASPTRPEPPAGMSPAAAPAKPDPDLFHALETFGDALAIVQKTYVGDVDGRKLVQAAMKGMMESLDARSDYYSTEEFLALRTPKAPGSARAANVTSRLLGDYGYVHVALFDERTGRDTSEAIRALQKEKPGLKGLVLDLRGNQGGLLDQSIEVAGHFLDGGEVATMRGRSAGDVERYNARRNGPFAAFPLVVLTDKDTASGAEIVAGALQDRGRAVLVGAPTAGAGTIQQVIPLRGGRDGALKVTVSRWTTPSGRSVQDTGLKPDILVTEAARAGKDPQLDRAVAVLKAPAEPRTGRDRA